MILQAKGRRKTGFQPDSTLTCNPHCPYFVSESFINFNSLIMETLNNLFHVGGPLFMGILTILLLILLATAVVFAIYISNGKAHKL